MLLQFFIENCTPDKLTSLFPGVAFNAIPWNDLSDTASLTLDTPLLRQAVSKLAKTIVRLSGDADSAEQKDFVSRFLRFKYSLDHVEEERVMFYAKLHFTDLFGDRVTVLPKLSGRSNGAIVQVEGNPPRKYYVKSHGEGHTLTRGSGQSTAKPVEPCELVFYRLFSKMKIGPECIIFGPDQVRCYIATLNAGPLFGRYDSVKKTHLGAWSATGTEGRDFSSFELSVGNDLVAQRYAQNLMFVHILTQVLGLADLVDNDKNFGFTLDTAELVILDFNVHTRAIKVMSQDDFDTIIEPTSSAQVLHYDTLDPFFQYILLQRDPSLRLRDVDAVMHSHGPPLVTALETARDELASPGTDAKDDRVRISLDIICNSFVALQAHVRERVEGGERL